MKCWTCDRETEGRFCDGLCELYGTEEMPRFAAMKCPTPPPQWLIRRRSEAVRQTWKDQEFDRRARWQVSNWATPVVAEPVVVEA